MHEGKSPLPACAFDNHSSQGRSNALKSRENRFGENGVPARHRFHLSINLCVFPSLRAIAFRVFALIVPSFFAGFTHSRIFLSLTVNQAQLANATPDAPFGADFDARPARSMR
jgi:hypothetical protein